MYRVHTVPDGRDRDAAAPPPEAFRQRVPRPVSARRVDPAADFVWWPDRATRCTLAAVRASFETGAGIGLEGAHQVGAAVLIALADGGDPGSSARIVLIRRAGHLRANPGEIALPGGWIEPGESALDAALREAEEEVGLARSAVAPLGAIAPVARVTRPQRILPFVGEVTGALGLQANPAEVDDVLVIPLVELADPARYWEERWELPDGVLWPMHFFDLGDDLIWGATARILSEFLDLLGRPAEDAESP